jgi:hypothetical protein
MDAAVVHNGPIQSNAAFTLINWKYAGNVGLNISASSQSQSKAEGYVASCWIVVGDVVRVGTRKT